MWQRERERERERERNKQTNTQTNMERAENKKVCMLISNMN